MVLSAILDSIVEAVSAGDKVSLVGFGSFEPRDRQAREGRNPKTGDKMTIAATRIPAFSVGKPLGRKSHQVVKSTNLCKLMNFEIEVERLMHLDRL